MNLIQNALKFTMHGSITVLVDFLNDMSMLKVTVKDTGIGVKKEDRDKLFKLFGKLESTSKVNTHGIGIGLTICMKIVQAYEGMIYLEE